MAISPEFRDHVLDLLAPLGQVEARRMFGGVGFFRHGLMFALIARDELYFKVDAESRPDFEAAGSGPFSYLRGGVERALGSYWRVPDEAMDDPEECLHWARRAVEAALAAERAKPAKRRKR